MSNKEFFVRHGLSVNNTVLTANVITNKVGIGTNNAAYTLDVIGSANISSPSLFVAGTNVLATLNSAYTIVNAAYDSSNSNWAVQNAVYDLANTIYASSNSNWQVQNAIYDLSNTVYASANSNWTVQNAVYDTVNTVFASSNSNWEVQNLVYATVNSNYVMSNAAYDLLNAAYGTVNATYASGNSNWAIQNTLYDLTNVAYNSSNSNWEVQNLVYATVNANYTMANAGYVALNSAYDTVNAVYGSSNSNWQVQNLVYATVNASYTLANAAYANANSLAIGANNWANTKLANTNNVWTAGSLNISQDLLINRNLINVTQVIFNTGTNLTPTTPGALTWSQDDSTLHFDMDSPSNVIGHIGQDLFYYVKNQTGETITKGTVVRFAGTTGASGRLLISKATANNYTPSKYVMGITAANIGNGEDGFVLARGKLRPLNTNGFSQGDILYVSPSVPGGLSNTMPEAPNNKITVGAVIHKDSTVGSIEIRVTYGSQLNEDEQVQLHAVANGDVIRYNSANGRFENFSENSLGPALNAAAAFAHSNSVAIAANAWSNTVGTAGNNYTNHVGVSANSYAGYMVNSSNSYADATYLKLTSPSQIITGDLSITGNVFLLGDATSLAANNLVINDSLIYLAANNDLSDILDIGFVGHYSNGTANLHTGLFRDHDSKQYFLFVDAAGPEPETLNDLVPYANGMINAILHTDIITSNIFLGGANAIHTISGAFDKANAAYANANAVGIFANAWANAVGIAGNNYTNAVGSAGNSYMIYVTTSGNTYAGQMANSVNSYAYNVGVSGNSLAVAIGLAGNSYTRQVGTAGNNYTDHVGLSVNTYTSILTANNSVGANAWANTVGTAGNSYALTTATSIGTAGNNYTNYVGASGNLYAQQVGTAGNNYASILVSNTAAAINSSISIVASSVNNYTVSVGTAGNNYASILAANNAVGANNWANTKLSNATGTLAGALTTTGQITSNGYLIITPSDGIQEGGEIQLLPASNYSNWILDSYQNNHRTFTRSGDTSSLANVTYFHANGGIIRMGVNRQDPTYTLDVAGIINASSVLINGLPVGAASMDYAYVNLSSGSANSWSNTVGASANAYALNTATNIGAASNNYASILIANNSIGANGWANTVGSAGNNYTNSVGTAGNNYTNSVGIAGNNYTNTVGAAGNSYSLTTATDIGTAGNNYSKSVGTAGNNYASILIANNSIGANGWANTVGTAGNNYTNSVGTAGNNYTNAVGTAGNNYTNSVGAAGNSYAQQVGAAANSYTSATYYLKSGGLISGDVGISGNLTISGTTTFANTQQLQVGDNIITLNADLPISVTPVENSGIEVNRGNKNSNATFLWMEATGQWGFTSNNAQTISTFVASNTLVEQYATAGNSYALITATNIGTAGNNYTNSVGVAGNNYASVLVANNSIAGNNYASVLVANVAAAINSNATIMDTAGNNYTNSVGIAGNNYASVLVANVAAAINANAAASYAAINSFSIVSETAGNNYASILIANTAAAINANVVTVASSINIAHYNYANSRVASVTSNSNARIWANTIIDATFSENVFIDLATSGVTAASYGSATNIPVVTIDAYGRVTYAANVSVQGMDYAYANNIGASANAWANTKTGGGAYVGNNGEIAGTGLGDIFRVHSNTLSTNSFVNTGNNAIAAGPISIAANRTLTINVGATVVIV